MVFLRILADSSKLSELESKLSLALEVDEIAQKMLEAVNEWQAVDDFFGVVMSTKGTVERARRLEDQ